MPSRDETLAVTLSILVALVIATLAVLAGTGVFGASRAAQPTVGLPNCSEWTDGCVICARTPQGLACSTPGIACTRGKPQCLKP